MVALKASEPAHFVVLQELDKLPYQQARGSVRQTGQEFVEEAVDVSPSVQDDLRWHMFGGPEARKVSLHVFRSEIVVANFALYENGESVAVHPRVRKAFIGWPRTLSGRPNRLPLGNAQQHAVPLVCRVPRGKVLTL